MSASDAVIKRARQARKELSDKSNEGLDKRIKDIRTGDHPPIQVDSWDELWNQFPR